MNRSHAAFFCNEQFAPVQLVRVVYVTDGDDNPWPQRVLERKWRLNAADRRRWGRLRRTEALAALRVLGVNGSATCFLALPDQKLTTC